jgi:hypothetical protein
LSKRTGHHEALKDTALRIYLGARAIVPVGIRDSIVQVAVETTTIRTIVRVTTKDGKVSLRDALWHSLPIIIYV